MEKFGSVKKKGANFFCSMISCVFYAFGFGVLFGISSINQYLVSYLHYENNWFDLQQGILMMILMSFSLSLFSPLSGLLEIKCSPIISIIISSFIIEICLFLYFLQQSIWFFYVITLFAGIGTGLSANILLRNACFYYPKKKGLISAIIIGFMGFFTDINSFLGKAIINPEGIPEKDRDKDPYYPYEVAKNVKKYFLFAMILFPIYTLITIIFFYKYDPNWEEEEEEGNRIGNDENIEEKEEINEILINNKKNPKPITIKNIKKAIFNFRFLRNMMIIYLFTFYALLIQCTFGDYILDIDIPQSIIFYLNKIKPLIKFISYIVGVIFASLVDTCGFLPIMKIIGIVISTMSIIFVFITGFPYFFIFGLFFFFLAFAGIIPAMIPHLMNIFGIKYFLIIGGCANIINGLSVFLANLFYYIFKIYQKENQDLIIVYRIFGVVGGIFGIIGLILVYDEKDDKLINGDENEDNKYLKKIDNNAKDNIVENEQNSNIDKLTSILDASSRTDNSNE